MNSSGSWSSPVADGKNADKCSADRVATSDSAPESEGCQRRRVTPFPRSCLVHTMQIAALRSSHDRRLQRPSHRPSDQDRSRRARHSRRRWRRRESRAAARRSEHRRGDRPAGDDHDTPRRPPTTRRSRRRRASTSPSTPSCRSPTATRSTCVSSGPTDRAHSPPCTTSTAAACRRCRATTATTARGAASSPPKASPSRWSTSATRSRPRRSRRWRRSPPD